MPALLYRVGSGARKIYLPKIVQQPSCGNTISKMGVAFLDASSDSIRSDEASSVTIETNPEEACLSIGLGDSLYADQIVNYIVSVTLNDQAETELPPIELQVHFTPVDDDLMRNQAPIFQSELTQTPLLDCQSSELLKDWKYQLPAPYDPEYHHVTLSVVLSPALQQILRLD
jgi:hypothetical protein